MSTTARRAAATLLSLIAIALITSCASPPGTEARARLLTRAEVEMEVSLPTFIEHRRAQGSPFDWSSDGCSSSPDRPFGFDFTAACWRHDFGYRNFLHGLALDPTSERKAAIDARLGTDLDTICRRHALWRRLCGQVAHLYVWAVRVAGH